MRTTVILKYVSALGMVASALSAVPTFASEPGYLSSAQKPGVTLGGASAGAPGPGIYMFEQFVTYRAKFTGPNAQNGPDLAVSGASVGLVIVPGWNFLGATYNAVIVAPFIQAAITAGGQVGTPGAYQAAGIHNTYIVPVELSWKLGDSGFFVKTGLGIYVPDGSIENANGLTNGLGNVGNPWYTFQPEFLVSYLKDGWNLTANVFAGFHTRNTISQYQSGTTLQAEFVATKTIGKWTFGPVGYYSGQVSADKNSGPFFAGGINQKRYDRGAAGGLVGYNFGPATFTVWGTDEFYASASGRTIPPNGVDLATVPGGYSVFAQLSYRIWSFDDDKAVSSKRPLFTK